MSAAGSNGSTAARRWSIPTISSSEADFESLPLIEPVYPMTAGLARKTLAAIVARSASRACRRCRNGSIRR